MRSSPISWLPSRRSTGPQQFAGRAGSRGQEAVEFALLVPLLLLIFFGVVDLGRILHAAITITNAAREGARFAMQYPDDVAGTEAVVIAEAAGSGIDLSDADRAVITVSCPVDETCPRGQPIRVEVDYEFQLIIAMVFGAPELPVHSYADMMVP